MTGKRLSKQKGSVAVLGRLKPWFVLILTILLTNGVIGALRVITEGTYYDRSLSSRPGDDLLGVYLAAASWVIHKDERTPDKGDSSKIEDSRLWHYATAGVSLLTGVVLQLVATASHGRQTPANTYHNLVVVSILSYFVVSTLPVMVKTRQRQAQFIAAIGLLGWFGLLIWDIKAGNLQRNNSRSG